MKHYQSVEFLSNFQCQPPCTQIKPLIEDCLVTVSVNASGLPEEPPVEKLCSKYKADSVDRLIRIHCGQ